MINAPNNRMITLQPAPGLLIRHPVSKKPLATLGEPVEISSYWQRRITAGDVFVVESEIGSKK